MIELEIWHQNRKLIKWRSGKVFERKIKIKRNTINQKENILRKKRVKKKNSKQKKKKTTKLVKAGTITLNGGKMKAKWKQNT